MKKIKNILNYIKYTVIFLITGVLLFAMISVFALDESFAMSDMLSAKEYFNFTTNLGNIYKESNDKQNGYVEEINRSSIRWPEYGDKYAKIECDTIGLSTYIYMGDNEKILREGVGQYYGSSIPGCGKKILIGGHNTTHFSSLEFIRENDVVMITTNYGKYEYKVYDIKVVKKDFAKAYERIASDKEELVMYTCYPFTILSGSKNQRLFVYAKKLSGPKILNDPTKKNDILED